MTKCPECGSEMMTFQEGQGLLIIIGFMRIETIHYCHKCEKAFKVKGDAVEVTPNVKIKPAEGY